MPVGESAYCSPSPKNSSEPASLAAHARRRRHAPVLERRSRRCAVRIRKMLSPMIGRSPFSTFWLYGIEPAVADERIFAVLLGRIALPQRELQPPPIGDRREVFNGVSQLDLHRLTLPGDDRHFLRERDEPGIADDDVVDAGDEIADGERPSGPVMACRSARSRGCGSITDTRGSLVLRLSVTVPGQRAVGLRDARRTAPPRRSPPAGRGRRNVFGRS